MQRIVIPPDCAEHAIVAQWHRVAPGKSGTVGHAKILQRDFFMRRLFCNKSFDEWFSHVKQQRQDDPHRIVCQERGLKIR